MTPTNDFTELKRLVAGIVRAQGNRFIKELLRDKGIRIGTNKDDFEHNLTAAIESGTLGPDDVENWLRLVEGWGNQHVYFYGMSERLREGLTRQKIRNRARKAGLDHLWDGKTLLAFPDKPQLTSISFSGSVFRLTWQESAPGWTPAEEKTYREVEGLDTYEYRAFRLIERRTITRFEAHLDKGIAALFIASPVDEAEHRAAMEEARRVLEMLLDFRELERELMDVAVVARNLDQRNLPNNNAPNPSIRAQKSRLASGGSYVEFAANSSEKAYWEEPAISDVRQSVRAQQLAAFQGGEGVFVFQPGTGTGDLTRALRVQLYARDNRIRLWKQMDAAEVWAILTRLSIYR